VSGVIEITGRPTGKGPAFALRPADQTCPGLPTGRKVGQCLVGNSAGNPTADSTDVRPRHDDVDRAGRALGAGAARSPAATRRRLRRHDLLSAMPTARTKPLGRVDDLTRVAGATRRPAPASWPKHGHPVGALGRTTTGIEVSLHCGPTVAGLDDLVGTVWPSAPSTARELDARSSARCLGCAPPTPRNGLGRGTRGMCGRTGPDATKRSGAALRPVSGPAPTVVGRDQSPRRLETVADGLHQALDWVPVASADGTRMARGASAAQHQTSVHAADLHEGSGRLACEEVGSAHT